MLIVLSAPSGAGKTTIAHALLDSVSGLRFSISATTRAKRGGEVDGVDYYFLDTEDFKRRIDAGELVEYEEIFGNYYGTLKTEIDKALQKGSHLLFDVDVKGGLSLKGMYPDDTVLVFVKPPSIEELRHRIEGRGTDSKESIETRLQRAEWELAQINAFDFVVVNDDLARAIDEVKEIVRKHTGLPIEDSK